MIRYYHATVEETQSGEGKHGPQEPFHGASSKRLVQPLATLCLQEPRDGSTDRNGFENQSLRRGPHTTCPLQCAPKVAIVKGHESAHGGLRLSPIGAEVG